MPDESQQKNQLVFRFLNTALAGCEYFISQEPVTFIIDKSTVIDVLSGSESSDAVTIFVTDEHLSAKFTVNNNEKCIHYIDKENIPKKESFSLYHKHEINDIKFVIRSGDDIWDEMKVVQPQSSIQSNAITPENKWDLKKYKWIALVTGTLCLLALLMIYTFDHEDKYISNLKSMIDKAPGAYEIRMDKTNAIYILAEKNNTANWIKQALVKNNPYNTIQVLTYQEVQTKVADVLRNVSPSLRYHTVKISSNNAITVVLSTERSGTLSQQHRNDIVGAIKSTFPWTKAINFDYLSDNVVSTFAENGFKSIVKDYSLTKNEDHVSISVSGELPDNVIYELKDFIGRFQSEWKGNYVLFSMNLENDWLKGKSYQYGEKGYIKMSPGHWFFNYPYNGDK
jgi:Type III secretion system protein PrgH-EprH (PrgH).